MKIVITQCIFIVIYLTYFVLGRLNKNSKNLKKIIEQNKDSFILDLDEDDKNYKFLQINNTLKNGTSNNSTSNSTKSPKVTKDAKEKEEFPLLVDKSPYLPVDCSQTVVLKAKRLEKDNNYAVKKDAFFTINPLRINVFDEMNADSLVNSLGMPGLDEHADILKGSLNCIFFHDEVKRHHNVSMCIDDKNTTNQVIEAYEFFRKCSPKKQELLSKIDNLEILVNTLSNPSQNEYKIPNFKRALAEDLKENGFLVANSVSKEIKSNCKKDARQIKFKRAKVLKQFLHLHKDGLDRLDKSINFVPGSPLPTEDEIKYGGHHYHH